MMHLYLGRQLLDSEIGQHCVRVIRKRIQEYVDSNRNDSVSATQGVLDTATSVH